MNWLKKIFGHTKTGTKVVLSPKIEHKRPESHDMTLERWQKDDGLVNWARTSSEFAWILSIAHNQQPSGFPIRGQAVSDIQCAVELGRKEGYADLENVLLALREHPFVAKEQVEADYDDTDYEQKEAAG